MTSNNIHHCVYLHCTYSNASVLNVQNHVAKIPMKKSRVNTRCVPGNKQSRALPVENNMTTVLGSIGGEDEVTREQRTVEKIKMKSHTRACIYDWAELILALCNSCSERHANRFVDLLGANNFELNGNEKKLNDGTACLLLICETGDESLKQNEFRTVPVSIERKSAATVSDLYKRYVIEVSKNHTMINASAAHLWFCMRLKEQFKSLTKTAHFSVLGRRTRQRRQRNSLPHVLRIDDNISHAQEFAEFVKIFPDYIALLQKASALAAYPVHMVLLKFIDVYKW